MDAPHNYRCPRCGNRTASVGEMHVAGGFWSKIFDVEGRKFTTVTCSRCRITEFFEADKSTLANVFDLFTT